MTNTLHRHREGITKEAALEQLHAAFSTAPSTADDTPAPTVVVRRRKAVATTLPGTQAGVETEPPPRSPRVFLLSAKPEGKGHDERAHAEVPADGGSVAAQAGVTPVRRRRRARPAPVTIIRPNAGTDAPPAANPSAGPQGKGEPRFGQSMADHQRYLEIQAQIQRLRQEAQLLREAEVAAAVAWIRKAIDDHGLKIEDLLGDGRRRPLAKNELP
jgi:hypothetical protein